MALSKEYFKNRQEQAKIKLAVIEAIPEGVRYDNLIIALSELLREYIWKVFEKDMDSE